MLRWITVVWILILSTDFVVADDAALAALNSAVRFNEVRTKDFDVEVSFVTGNSEDGQTQRSSEYRIIARQVYDSKSTKFICPFADGAVSFKAKEASNSASDSKEAGIYFGDAWSVALERVIGSTIVPQFGCAGNCIDLGCPVDLVQLVSNPFCMSPKARVRGSDAQQLENLTKTLTEAGMKSEPETRNNRRVIVYSIDQEVTVPQTKAEIGHVIALVVSAEGPDEGLLLEFNWEYYRADKEKKQKLIESTQSHKIEWKQFSHGEQKVVLPVMVTKKKMYAFGKANSYVNAKLQWREFDDQSRKLLEAEQSKKLAKEYDSKIEKALNR